jgi:hypothetical protein
MEPQPTSSPVEDIMFRTKSRTEQFQDQSESLANTALADQLRQRVIPAVGQATENARTWAKPRVEHGIEVAAPHLESAVNGLAPKVDTARDKIVEELIPRLAEAINAWAAASTAARAEGVSRGIGAAAVISGNAIATPKKSRKRRVLLILTLVGGAAAAATAFMKRSAPKDDPWTTPLADRYTAPPNNRNSSGSLADEGTDASRTQSEIIDSMESHMSGPGDLTSGTDASDDDLTGTGSLKDDKVAELDDKNNASKNNADKKESDKNPGV